HSGGSMTNKIGKGPKAHTTSKASKAESKKTEKAETKKAEGAKVWAEKSKASDKAQFPRAGWKDTNKLSDALAKHQTESANHPRLRHTGPDHGHKPPPIVMRYGVFPVHPDPVPVHPQPPPVVMRYGVFPVHPTPGPVHPPPIVM